jgi:hypothetical protein
MLDYKLCLDYNNRYVYNCNNWNKETYFYKYIKLEELKYLSWSVETTINNAYKVISKVIWYKKWYHEFEIKTIVTDWGKL